MRQLNTDPFKCTLSRAIAGPNRAWELARADGFSDLLRWTGSQVPALHRQEMQDWYPCVQSMAK